MSDTTNTSIYTALPTSTTSRTAAVPLAASPVAAGFPSPADDVAERSLDLNDYIVKHPAATFYVRAAGLSMQNAGILPGDLLVVDRAVEPYDGAIVIAVLDGEFTVKRFKKTPSGFRLVAENTAFRDIEISEGQTVDVWGVVTWVVHSVATN